jgi:hypothetical protein
MTVGGLVDTVFRFNRLCECQLYTAPRNKPDPMTLVGLIGQSGEADSGSPDCNIMILSRSFTAISCIPGRRRGVSGFTW